MKNITIRFYGMLVEETKTDKLEIQSLANDIFELNKEILKQFPKLRNYVYQVALNEKLVDDSVEIKSNDVIAFLPPFAGG